MKITWTCAMSTIAILLQQLETPLAFGLAPFCLSPVPTCLAGSLDTEACQCNRESDSTCPSGFTYSPNSPNLCFCERRTQPLCNGLSWLTTATCRCEVVPKPLCLGPPCDFPTTDPDCPPGSVREGCRCVEKAQRECSSGELSSDQCTCIDSPGRPLCVGHRCELNSDSCSCDEELLPESGLLLCYTQGSCSGPSTLVSNVGVCCSRGLLASYRIGNDGPCVSCLQPIGK